MYFKYRFVLRVNEKTRYKKKKITTLFEAVQDIRNNAMQSSNCWRGNNRSKYLIIQLC
jgi:hypothetical protein